MIRGREGATRAEKKGGEKTGEPVNFNCRRSKKKKKESSVTELQAENALPECGTEAKLIGCRRALSLPGINFRRRGLQPIINWCAKNTPRASRSDT